MESQDHLNSLLDSSLEVESEAQVEQDLCSDLMEGCPLSEVELLRGLRSLLEDKAAQHLVRLLSEEAKVNEQFVMNHVPADERERCLREQAIGQTRGLRRPEELLKWAIETLENKLMYDERKRDSNG